MCICEILFQDPFIVAVSKPPGMLVHRTRIAADTGPFLLQQARDITGRRLYPVHRLDRPTSGVVLFAMTPDSARALSESFRDQTARKTYLAVVRGWIEEEGRIDTPLDRPVDWSQDEGGRPREALTEFSRLGMAEIPIAVSRHPTSRYSLVKVHPVTGRRHQIRRHLRRISHPVIGDVEYGDGRHNRFFRNHFGIGRLLLHAERITLGHPATCKPLTITSQPYGEFKDLCRTLGWDPQLLTCPGD